MILICKKLLFYNSFIFLISIYYFLTAPKTCCRIEVVLKAALFLIPVSFSATILKTPLIVSVVTYSLRSVVTFCPVKRLYFEMIFFQTVSAPTFPKEACTFGWKAVKRINFEVFWYLISQNKSLSALLD